MLSRCRRGQVSCTKIHWLNSELLRLRREFEYSDSAIRAVRIKLDLFGAICE